MKVELPSDYVQVGLWLGLLEKTYLLSGKVCEIFDENVKAPHQSCHSFIKKNPRIYL